MWTLELGQQLPMEHLLGTARGVLGRQRNQTQSLPPGSSDTISCHPVTVLVIWGQITLKGQNNSAERKRHLSCPFSFAHLPCTPAEKAHAISQAHGQTSCGYQLASTVSPQSHGDGPGAVSVLYTGSCKEFHFLGELRHNKSQEALPGSSGERRC